MTSSLVVNHRPVEATKGWSCQQTIQFLGWIVWEFIRPSDIIWPYLTVRTYKRPFECSKPWNIWRVPMMAKWFDPPGGWKTPGLSRIHQRRSQWEDWSLEQQISAFRNLELQLESHLTCVCVWCSVMLILHMNLCWCEKGILAMYNTVHFLMLHPKNWTCGGLLRTCRCSA